MSIAHASRRWMASGAAVVLLAGGPPVDAHAARTVLRPTPAASLPSPGLATDGAALLVRSCGGCHAPGQKGARDLLLFDAAGRLAPVALRTERELILETVATNHGRPRLTPAEVDLLRRWLDASNPPG